jgi:hypothetical protein
MSMPATGVEWLLVQHDPTCPRLAARAQWPACHLGYPDAELSIVVREPEGTPIVIRDVVKRWAA